MAERDAKRQRTTSEMEFNDSIASMISEFRLKPEPSNKDIGDFLAAYVEKSVQINSEVRDLRAKIDVVEDKVENMKMDFDGRIKSATTTMSTIQTIQAEQNLEVDNMKPTVARNEASVHILEQDRVDNHVYLSGFPTKPEAKAVATILCNKFSLDPGTVEHSFDFSFDVKPKQPESTSTPVKDQEKPKVIFNVVIMFKDRSAKMKFMIAKSAHGPLFYEMFTTHQLDPKDNVSIRCNNRLSKFNLRVQHALHRAKTETKIFKFQLHNGLMRFQRIENGPWTRIATNDDLKSFLPKKRLQL